MKPALISIHNSHHQRLLCPLSVEAPMPAGRHVLAAADDPAYRIPARSDGLRIWFILPELEADSSIDLTVGRPAETSETAGIDVIRDRDKLLFAASGRLLVVYHFGAELIRPYFFPLNGPGNLAMTRSWPLEQDVEGEDHDHPHHKSFWVAHGAVNGSDHWGEEGSGRQAHADFEWVGGGDVFGGFDESLSWRTVEGKRLLREKRSFRLWNTGLDFILMDLTSNFQADNGDVLFGDTKEGGLCSLRVAESMKGSRGGCIENAWGGLGEKECWGKRSPWVDYSGMVEGLRIGAAIMDHPRNPRFPTYWHVRDYGLFSANPFGLSYYQSSYETNGDWLLHRGQSATFRYRIVLHRGDAQDASIRERYLDWAVPPEAVWKS